MSLPAGTTRLTNPFSSAPLSIVDAAGERHLHRRGGANYPRQQERRARVRHQRALDEYRGEARLLRGYSDIACQGD